MNRAVGYLVAFFERSEPLQPFAVHSADNEADDHR